MRLIRPNEHAFLDVAQVEVGAEVWASAKHKWRTARVVQVRGSGAMVAFRLATAPRIVCQAVPLISLMRREWEPPARLRLRTTVPTLEEARMALATKAA